MIKLRSQGWTEVAHVVEGNRPADGAMRSHLIVGRLGVVAFAGLMMGCGSTAVVVERILTGRHERLVDACMAAHGYEMYVPEADDNADGHLNAEIMDSLSAEDREGWLQAWKGSADDVDPGCVDQFNEQVYPLAGIPELGPYVAAISDDPRFIEAGSVYDACMLKYPIRADGTPGPRALECGEPLDEVRHTVYREQVLEFLRLHFDVVQEFGRRGKSL